MMGAFENVADRDGHDDESHQISGFPIPKQNQFISSYPLVMTNVAIENTPFIVDLPIENGDFP